MTGTAPLTDQQLADIRQRIAAAFEREDAQHWGYDHGFSSDLDQDPETAAFVDAALAVVQPELDRRAGCPDPIECDHEAAAGQLAEDLRYLLAYDGPRHAHMTPGIWDDTLAPCTHCARLEQARQHLAAFAAGSTT